MHVKRKLAGQTEADNSRPLNSGWHIVWLDLPVKEEWFTGRLQLEQKDI